MQSELKFNNGKFKIMQIADTQEKYPVNPDTVKLIDLAVKREKPDLVVFTGDQICGYAKCFKENTFDKVNEVLSALTKPLNDNDIPFCVTFGNHDRDCKISNAKQFYEIYTKFPMLINAKPRNDEDAGTYSVQIKDSKNEKNIFNLYIIDSNAKEKDGAYSPVYKEQVDWYINERERLKEQNGTYLPSLVFQHIPVPEIFKAIKKCSPLKRGAVEAFFSHSNEFYVLFDDSIQNGGFMHESPAAPDINNGEFEAMKEKGDVLGIFFGHDHINSFVKNVEGIDLGYTQGCGFNTYGPGKDRGVRMFVIDENDTKHYETYTVTMKELCDFKPSKPLQEFVLTHAPTSVEQVKKNVLRVGAAAGTVAIICKVLKKIK